MSHRQALETLAVHRGQRVVITTHGSIDLWVSMSNTPLDFAYVPTSMGQAQAFGLGLALAQPQRGVIVVTGEGSLLMNLGSLVTLAGQQANLVLVLIDNGVYEVTGGQVVPGAGRTDFAGLARAAGVARAYSFATATAWQSGAAEALAAPGPAVIWLRVAPRQGQRAPTQAPPMAQQMARLKQALGATSPC
jgi:thiamine pyrophosphate-dependent acetolactate synthase large subunit-like protein